ncbi:hypothetical protein OZN62_06480 [Aurantiacibacter sp. MUD11]|uniref:hypothetical protein n=1 Tax=Aurantiacibacter sp. MUD11 TaxID=3003265 RepID=UPI0022AA01C1|nr:hypothetical protein [Aurantiacibacter sp. MUD11]WAT19207.1 hypothetical protein OZN62_06480 [Aurantiacibacter sp. MUD11]
MAVHRFLGKTATLAVLLVFFTSLAAVLHVRAAIANGALDEPHICLNENHYDWRKGDYPTERTVWLSADQVRYHHLQHSQANMRDWHLQGAFAGLGIWLGYSEDRRQRMAERVVAGMPDCPPRHR